MIPNVRPEFTWIDKNLLIVPRSGAGGYQRLDDTQQRYVGTKMLAERALGQRGVTETIRRHFNWSLFGAISVVHRPNGDFAVLDGGHRLDAIRHMDSVTAVPCLTYRVETVKEEAAIFRAVNRIRTALNNFDDYKAALVAEDEIALRMASIMAAIGRNFSPAKRAAVKGVTCIKAVRRAMEKNETAVRAILPLLDAVCGQEYSIDQHLFGAFFIAESKLMEQKTPRSLATDYRQAVLDTGYKPIELEIRRERSDPDKQAAPADWARAFIRAVNQFNHISIKLEQPGRKALGKPKLSAKAVEIRSQVGPRHNGGAHAAA